MYNIFYFEKKKGENIYEEEQACRIGTVIEIRIRKILLELKIEDVRGKTIDGLKTIIWQKF